MAWPLPFPYVERNRERGRLIIMPRLVLAVLVLAVLVGCIVFLLRTVRRAAAGAEAAIEREPGSAMQRVAFILLLGLILYVSFGGVA